MKRVLSHVGWQMLTFAALLASVVGCCLLTVNAEAAHALFTSDVRMSEACAVKPFPTSLSVKADGYVARAKDIDRNQLTVTATFSDGTTRELGKNEYDLSTAEFPGGHKGALDSEAVLEDGGHKVTASFSLSANEAYAAQYADTLVFGRGIPADTYQSKTLANTTWGVEDTSFTKRWNKDALVSVVDIDTVSLRACPSLFESCPKLRTVALDQVDTSRATSMAFMFRWCSALTTVTGTEKWNTGNVTSLWGMFYEDFALSSVNVSNWNTTKVTTVRSMFDCCYSLTSVDLSRWKTPSLTVTRSMFYMVNRPTQLTTVGDISGWDMSHVTDMGNMFDCCTKLKSVGSLKDWNTSNVTNMEVVFANCYELTGVNCYFWDVSKVTNHFDFDRNTTGIVRPSFTS